MNKLINFAIIGAIIVVSGCATTDPAEERAAKEAQGVFQAPGDPNPYSDYTLAMADEKDRPMAVVWQNRNDAKLKTELKPEALKAYVMLPKNADDLLAQVKPDYGTDAMVATKIAAVSQLVMCTKWDKAPAAREIWTKALLSAAANAPDEYRKMFFLDQLRWCGKADQSARVLEIGKKSGSKAVSEFAVATATEMRR